MSGGRWLELNGMRYRWEQLTDPEITEHARTEFEKSTLTFCRDWLSGKETFTLTTSGSTGTPKPITLRRNQMAASAHATLRALGIKSEDHALVCLDTHYIAGQMMLVRSILGGLNMIAIEPSANPFKKTGNYKIDFAALVPYQIEAIVQEGYAHKLNELKCGIVGGASISETLMAKLQNVKSALYATYGMTETISHIALQRLNGPDRQDSFEVIGDTKINQDERGCLVITTTYLEEPIVTNDLVELLDASHFRWLGRFDHVINSGGVKISPESLEKIIEPLFTDIPLQNRFFIAGVPDEKLGERVVLFIEGRLTKQLQDEMLNNLATKISRFELPKEVRLVTSFQETKSGKMNRVETVLASGI